MSKRISEYKAIASEINIGTEDAKFISPAQLAASKIVKGAASVSNLVVDYKRTSDTVYDLVCQYTGQYFSVNKATTKPGGAAISDADVDNIIYFKINAEYFIRNLINGVVSVKIFGAVGADASITDNSLLVDEGAKIQKAIDYAISIKGSLLFHACQYYSKRVLSFSNIAPVSNGSAFGLTVSGSGMGTIIKFDVSNAAITGGALAVAFDFNSASDLQVNLSNIFAYDLNSNLIGLRLNHISRYSTFSKLRLNYFKVGHSYIGECYGVSFYDCYIRGSKNEAIFVDDVAISGGVLTEFHYQSCYIDNNGTAGANGGSFVSTLNLFNCQEFLFLKCKFEGNFGGGLNIRGASENIIFFATRFEETQIGFGTGGHIHNFASTVTSVTFMGGCEITYNKVGTNGLKSYQAMLCNNKQTIITNCQLIESSGSNPTDFFGATPLTNTVKVSDCMLGIYQSGSFIYPVQIPVEFNSGTIQGDLTVKGAGIFGKSGGAGQTKYVRNSGNIAWYAGLKPDNSDNKFYIYNILKDNFLMIADETTDLVQFFGNVRGASPQSTNDFVTKGYLDPKLSTSVFSVTDAATVTLNASTASTFRWTLGGNRTIAAPSSPTDGQIIRLRLVQDATGSRTITWNAVFRFNTSLPQPTLTTTAGKADFLEFIYTSADTKWDCIRIVQGI